MDQYICITCGWLFDPDEGDPGSETEPGTMFSELDDNWICPNCGEGKDVFEIVDE